MVRAERGYFTRPVRSQPVAEVRALFTGVVALMYDGMSCGRVEERPPRAVVASRMVRTRSRSGLRDDPDIPPQCGTNWAKIG